MSTPTKFTPIRFRYVAEVEGIMHCIEHDDFAIEGYDWSDMCQTAYHDPDLDGTCDLRAMFIQSNLECVRCNGVGTVAQWGSAVNRLRCERCKGTKIDPISGDQEVQR